MLTDIAQTGIIENQCGVPGKGKRAEWRMPVRIAHKETSIERDGDST